MPDILDSADPQVFKAQPETALMRDEFTRRYREQFADPRFKNVSQELERVIEVAWQNYQDHRKAPVTVKAGAEFKDPDYDLSAEWLEVRNKLREAERVQKSSPTNRILLISGSPRNDHTCPGETPKSWRLIQAAKEVMEGEGAEVDFLDLSELTAVYGRKIHPCKACVSTAMPLCHWPCSCYPNHSVGQTQDWMAEIYERWVRAHGVMIVTPVHWYQAPSPLKLMMDRLVCADGGNPDPTSTHGKTPTEAKRIELAGWDFPKHLKGRSYSVIAHGDAAGAESVRRGLCDWLEDMQLLPAGLSSSFDTYIGYYKPYATSHQELDAEPELFTEVKNAAISLVRHVRQQRLGSPNQPDEGLKDPRQK